MIRLLLAICLSVEGIAFYIYNSILFSTPGNRVKRIAIYIAAYICVFLFHDNSSYLRIVINILLFLAANVFILIYLYRLRFLSALLHALLISAFSIIAEVFVGDAVQQFVRNIWSDLDSLNYLVLLSPSALVFLLLTVSAALIEKRCTESGVKAAEITMIIALSGISFAAIIFNYLGVIGVTDGRKKDFFLTVDIIVFLTLIICFISMFNYMRHQRIMTGRQKQLSQSEKDAADYLSELKERDLEQRIMIHDIKNHLNALQMMIKSGNTEGIESYIQELTASPALAQTIRYCANDLMNSIIFRYMKEAERNHIRLSVDSNSVDFDFVDDQDLTVIMCDLLDNAIEAAKDTEDGYILITLTRDADKHFNMIRIVNSCKETLKFNRGIPVSDKPEIMYHGLGIKSVIRRIKKYNGDIHMYQDGNNDFHTVVLLNEVSAS